MTEQTIPPTYQGFVDYVNSQPPRDSIDHSRWSWCAIGQYLNSIGYWRSYYGEEGDVAAVILPTSLYEELSEGARARVTIPTYGALSDFISKL